MTLRNGTSRGKWNGPFGEKTGKNKGATGFDGKSDGLEGRVEDPATSINGGNPTNVNNDYALAA